MVKIKLTEKQYKILNYIWKFQKENYSSPSQKEIGLEMNISSSATIHNHIKRLIKSGYLYKNNLKRRSLKISDVGLKALKLDSKTNQIPILANKIINSKLIEDEQNIKEYFPIPFEYQYLKGSLLMIQINDEGMNDIKIIKNDFVIIRKQSHVENGDIVVAMLDNGQMICRRFFKMQCYYQLKPENKKVEQRNDDKTIKIINLYKVNIIGKVISLYRKYIS